MILGLCAPLFALLYFHYLKMKYMMSNFTKEAFTNLDEALKKYLPGFIYNSLISFLK
jgi:hypothetical protein